MKSIAANLLKPDMIFSKPVYIDESNILVPAGVPIRQKDLDNLQAWGIEHVQTDGVPSLFEPKAPPERAKPAAPNTKAEPAPKEAPAPKPPAHSPLSLPEVQGNKAAYRIYMSFIERMNMILLKISSKDNITSHPINILASELLQAVRDQRERFIGFILGGEVKGYEMAKSSVNTAILSALMAHELRLPPHKTTNVIIGALLHDAGMLRLPREIIDKKGELSEAERQRMKSHPSVAYNIVTKELHYYDDVGEIVLQHHERWDGEGYPHHTAGERIDLGARIVSIADAFEAMVSHKPYRNPIVGNQAIKNLLADNSRRFDPELLKSFIMTMGIYPIGSVVLLNNGAITRVSEARPNAPLRPKVHVLIDEYKKVYKNDEGAFIDLLVAKNLYITKTISEKELSGMHA